jgi:integrase
MGVYPDVSLKQARVRRDEARAQVADDVDPGEERKLRKAALAGPEADTFEVVTREWFAKFSNNWVPSHGNRIIRRFERDIFPWIGDKPVHTVVPRELLQVLRRIEDRGALETAHRALQNCGQVFRYAVATGLAERDPSQDLRGALPPAKERHHPAITDPSAVGDLLRTIDGYEGLLVTRCALRLAPLVFVRPGELRRAEWKEISLDSAEWRIPAEKMKVRKTHIVPLSRQAKEILLELHPLTGGDKYVFPGVRSCNRPMSENTVNAALRRLGFTKEQMTGHGFRSMASTMLHEMGWPGDVIERQLSHVESNNVKAAYNFAQHLPERVRMMQAWADYLDGLRNGISVVPIGSTGRGLAAS